MTSDTKRLGVARRVTITGTRSITTEAEARLAGLFEGVLRPFAGSDSTCYLGGAAGVDTAALEWLAEHAHTTLIVVVPCSVADQPAAAGEAILRWTRQGRLADVVELCAEKLGSSAYHARNRWMVDRSGLVIGFPAGSNRASGTWYTLNYAAEQGKPRLVVPI